MDNFATIIGYHGCERALALDVVNRKKRLQASANDYDWLGNGIYFWENDAKRAFDWARRSGKKDPYVLGAVIMCSSILDLTTQEARMSISKAYDFLGDIYKTIGFKLPKNTSVSKDDCDLKNRKLDCLVMNHVQEMSPFDAFVAPFIEGNPIYEGSMFREYTHIQIAVKNEKAIVGYFIPVGIKDIVAQP